MRTTSVLRVLLALHQTRVTGFEFSEDGLVVDVAPTYRIPRCSECGRKVHGTHDSYVRQWRHLDLAGIHLELRYRQRRVPCPSCGVRVEQVPWAEPASTFTRAFEGHVAYLAQNTDRTTVSELMRIAWRTVGSIIRRVVRRRQTEDRLDGLRVIGVDELS